jgi:hypothetical protein
MKEHEGGASIIDLDAIPERSGWTPVLIDGLLIRFVLWCLRHERRTDPRSLRAQPEPGCAVLNWLWLALAHQRLGDSVNARSWLPKASSWLDALGDQMPANSSALKLHQHNQIGPRKSESLPGLGFPKSAEISAPALLSQLCGPI